MLIDILEPNFYFEDERGTLTQLVREGYSQINVISSCAGTLRGGHFHKDNSEAFYIISGKLLLEAWMDGADTKESYVFNSKDMFSIPANVAHNFYFEEETVLVSMYSRGVELADGTKDIFVSEDSAKNIEKIK